MEENRSCNIDNLLNLMNSIKSWCCGMVMSYVVCHKAFLSRRYCVPKGVLLEDK